VRPLPSPLLHSIPTIELETVPIEDSSFLLLDRRAMEPGRDASFASEKRRGSFKQILVHQADKVDLLELI